MGYLDCADCYFLHHLPKQLLGSGFWALEAYIKSANLSSNPVFYIEI